jgi:hypothetical protein
MSGYELFNAAFESVGHAKEIVCVNSDDATKLAKAYLVEHGPCIIVRCSDGVALASYGDKPRDLLRKWSAAMLPGVARGAA